MLRNNEDSDVSAPNSKKRRIITAEQREIQKKIDKFAKMESEIEQITEENQNLKKTLLAAREQRSRDKIELESLKKIGKFEQMMSKIGELTEVNKNLEKSLAEVQEQFFLTQCKSRTQKQIMQPGDFELIEIPDSPLNAQHGTTPQEPKVGVMMKDNLTDADPNESPTTLRKRRHAISAKERRQRKKEEFARMGSEIAQLKKEKNDLEKLLIETQNQLQLAQMQLAFQIKHEGINNNPLQVPQETATVYYPYQVTPVSETNSEPRIQDDIFDLKTFRFKIYDETYPLKVEPVVTKDTHEFKNSTAQNLTLGFLSPYDPEKDKKVFQDLNERLVEKFSSNEFGPKP